MAQSGMITGVSGEAQSEQIDAAIITIEYVEEDAAEAVEEITSGLKRPNIFMRSILMIHKVIMFCVALILLLFGGVCFVVNIVCFAIQGVR